MQFEGRVPGGPSSVASDGADFLVTFSASSYQDEGTYAQLVSHGRAAGAAFFVGSGGEGSVVWTDRIYLISFLTESGIAVARVSRGGTLLGSPTVVLSGRYENARLCANGPSVLLTANSAPVDGPGNLIDLALDAEGAPVSSAVVLGPAVSFYDIVAYKSGFALAMIDLYRLTIVVRLDGDGHLLDPAGIVIEDDSRMPFFINVQWPAIGTDGSQLLVAFSLSSLYSDSSQIRTAALGDDGHLIRTSASVFSIPEREADLRVRRLLWDGHAYVAAVSIPSAEKSQAATMRFDATGARISDPISFAIGDLPHVVVDAMQSASETLYVGYDVLNIFEGPVWLATSSRGELPRQQADSGFGRVATRQESSAVAAMGRQYLVAWLDESVNGVTLRATRLDHDGNVLDVPSIVVAPVALERTVRQNDAWISIDGDGARWLVTWSDGARVHGAFVRADGVVDPAIIELGSGTSVAVRWGGQQYVALFSDDSLHTASILPSGTVTSSRILLPARVGGPPIDGWVTDRRFQLPALASAGGELLAVYVEEIGDHSSVLLDPFCCATEQLEALRIDADGASLDPGPTVLGLSSGRASVAADDHRYLITWQNRGSIDRIGGISAAFIPARAPSPNPLPFSLTMTGSAPSVAWNGKSFNVVWQTASLGIGAITVGGASVDTIGQSTELTFGDNQTIRLPVVAADALAQPLIAFVDNHDFVDDFSFIPEQGRIAALFVEELVHPAAIVPASPILLSAGQANDSLSLRWMAVPGVLAYGVELLLPDGTRRQIATLPVGPTSAAVPLMGLRPVAVRLIALNLAGPSAPSSEVRIPGRRRGVSVR